MSWAVVSWDPPFIGLPDDDDDERRRRRQRGAGAGVRPEDSCVRAHVAHVPTPVHTHAYFARLGTCVRAICAAQCFLYVRTMLVAIAILAQRNFCGLQFTIRTYVRTLFSAHNSRIITQLLRIHGSRRGSRRRRGRHGSRRGSCSSTSWRPCVGRDGGEGSGGGAAGANGKDLDPAGHKGSLLVPCSVVVRAESGPDRGGFQTAPCEELLSFSDSGVHIRDPLQKNLARRVQSSARLARSPKVPTGGVLRGVGQSDHFFTRRRGQERHRACRVRTRVQERRTASRRDTAVRGTPSWCNCCHLILELRTHLSGGWSYVRTYVRTSNRLFNREYVRTYVRIT